MFLWTKKEKRLNTISEIKSKTIVHLKYTTLLAYNNKAKIWPAVVARLGLPDFAELGFVILYIELVMLSFTSFPFVVLFFQVFWYKFAILFTFFSKNTNHFLIKPSTLFLSLVLLSSCALRFHVSPSLFLIFFLFLELSFFRFRCQTVCFEYLIRF